MVRGFEQIHPQLPPMRLASRNGRLYTGPCPFCADGGEDRSARAHCLPRAAATPAAYR